MNFNINIGKYNKKTRYTSIIKISGVLITIYLICAIIKILTSDITIIINTVVFLSIFFFLIYKASDVVDYLMHRNISFTERQFNVILSAFTPRQFEIFCYELFKALGYRAYLTPPGADGGKDVIVNNSIYVECKRYNHAMIGREICQKLLGALTADKMKEGIIFTNGDIHKNAIEVMNKTDKIKVWNRKVIYIKSNSLKSYELSKMIDLVLESE